MDRDTRKSLQFRLLSLISLILLCLYSKTHTKAFGIVYITDNILLTLYLFTTALTWKSKDIEFWESVNGWLFIVKSLLLLGCLPVLVIALSRNNYTLIQALPLTPLNVLTWIHAIVLYIALIYFIFFGLYNCIRNPPKCCQPVYDYLCCCDVVRELRQPRYVIDPEPVLEEVVVEEPPVETSLHQYPKLIFTLQHHALPNDLIQIILEYTYPNLKLTMSAV